MLKQSAENPSIFAKNKPYPVSIFIKIYQKKMPFTKINVLFQLV